MPITFPASLPNFLERLRVQSNPFELPETTTVSRTSGGELLSASIGETLWYGNFTLGRLSNEEADEAQVLIDLMRRPEASFFVYDLRAPYPRLDPNGTSLGAATPYLKEVSGNNRSISLADLPLGYTLKRGDKIAFQYGSNPTRFALHRVVEASVTAVLDDSLVVTPLFEVQPNIRPGFALATPVDLTKPSCKATYIPGSYQIGTRRRSVTEGMSFSWLQTLR